MLLSRAYRKGLGLDSWRDGGSNLLSGFPGPGAGPRLPEDLAARWPEASLCENQGATARIMKSCFSSASEAETTLVVRGSPFQLKACLDFERDLSCQTIARSGKN